MQIECEAVLTRMGIQEMELFDMEQRMKVH